MGNIFSKKKGKYRKKVSQKPKSMEWIDFDDDEEWDDEESYEDDEIEYEDEDGEEYEDEDDEEYEDEDGEEYEDEDDEEYEDEDDEEYEDEDDEEYEDEDDEEYEGEDDEEYEDEDDGYYQEPESRWEKIVDFFTGMSMVDYALAFTGVIVLVAIVVAGSLYLGKRADAKQVAAFMEIGEGIEGIPVIGESGLLAISDAQLAKQSAAELEEIEQEATQVDEETGKIEVVMNLTSIQKDLKIKFANKTSGKLIPSVPFEVEIKAPSGDTYVLKDEDQDGIIYQKDIAAGKYTVAMIALDNLSDYSFSGEAVSVTVKDTIEYKKVEVKDEIKTEAQVNVKVEDTAVNDTVVESTNTDTVEWVESTKTLIEGTGTTSESYEKVDKKDITDPETKTAAGFRLLTEVEVPVEPEETPTEEPKATEEPKETDKPQEPDKTEAPVETKEPEVPVETKEPEVPVETKEPEVPVEKPTASPSAGEVPVESPSPAVTPTTSPKPSASPTVTPKPTTTPGGARTDTKTDLKSNSGDKLYIKDSNGNYKEAKYADYYSSKEFYKKVTKTTGEYRYTGWQTIDGATYFFDKNGNKVTGEQVIQGAKYTFNANGVLNTGSGHMGIDVSKWNGKIDWNAVKNSGVSYVIIRCGYRGSTTGALIEDPMFRTNIQGARNAGIKVGVYFFTQAVNEVEAVEEASMVLSLISGYNLSYPVFLDVESSNGRADSISVDTRTAVCKAFCQTIQNSGYSAGIYANKTWLNEHINAPALTGYKIWLAQYAAAPSYTRTKYDMWQYSSKGKVSGISGNTDMNISYLGY